MSQLKLYNTLTKEKEDFTPIHPGKVTMYTCGPTVYGYQHIGNYKSFMTADVLYRYLTHGPNPYEVKYIQNITDVGHLTEDDLNQGDTGEDKMIKKAKAENKTPQDIAKYYTNYHFEKSEELNLSEPMRYPRATQYIDKMIAMIENLIAKGHAYASNGNVFFDVESFADYGKLSGNTLTNLQTGARLEEPHADKRNQWDFALWLQAPKEHLMQWNSPWGAGYPGWHIECSAMATEELDTTIDIHTGGEDHIFPHHEAEIAQSEGATDKPFANYWLHTRHMMIEGKKMSKSKGTLLTIEDVKEEGFSPMDLRMTYLQSHYRSQMNFTWDSLIQAKSTVHKIEEFYQNLLLSKEKKVKNEKFWPYDDVDPYKYDFSSEKESFNSSMSDDLNTPSALESIHSIIHNVNSGLALKSKEINSTHGHVKASALGYIDNFQEIINFFDQSVINVLGIELKKELNIIPQKIIDLAEMRVKARDRKDFQESDKLRDEIAEAGYTIKDAANGYRITKT